jgi:hypothetical protein
VAAIWDFLAGILADAWNFVEELFRPVWEVIAVALPPVVAVGLLMGFLVAVRRAILQVRRRSPRLQVSQFGWAGSGEEREALWVTSLFRDHLKALQVDGLDPLPDRAPGAPLVEIVEGVGQGVSKSEDLGKALGRLYRAAVPGYSYEVWATLSPDGPGAGSISVQLIERGRGNPTLAKRTIKNGPWEQVTREAALTVAGALYPRLANCHKGPWSRWRKPLPPDLLGLYQDALEHETGNRLEQALGGFREALKKDPLNPHLRLKVAMLEERLELHLDAWFTYRAIIDESQRKLWKGPQRRVRLLALYRLAIHLWNPGVAQQWVNLPNLSPDAPKGQKDEAGRPANAHERALLKIRAQLQTALQKDWFLTDSNDERQLRPRAHVARASAAELIDSLAVARCPEACCCRKARDELIKPFLDDWEGTQRARKRQVREVLQVMSLRYLEELDDRMRVLPRSRTWAWPDRLHRRPPPGRWLRSREFYAPVVSVSELLVRVRIAAAAERRLKTDDDERERLERMQRTHDAELLRKWPIRLDGSQDRPLPSRLRRARVWFADRRREDAWLLHYNAACTIASLLLRGDSILRDWALESRQERTRDAVEQLESFAHLARSGHVADMADWIVAGDHDLDGIHQMPEFRLWASHHLGFEPPQKRPLRTVDTDRYTVLLIHRGAEALAGKWRERAGARRAPVEKLVGWWREEKEIWEGVCLVLTERNSWHERLKALEALERWNKANDRDAIDLAHETWDAEKQQEKLAPDFFVSFSEILTTDQLPPAWVPVRAREVSDECDEHLQLTGSTSIELSDQHRKAAMDAARTWTWLAKALDEVLKEGVATGSVGDHLNNPPRP